MQRYYSPDMLGPLCVDCENYGRNYACPPLDIDVGERIAEYNFIHIFAQQFDICTLTKTSAGGMKAAFERARKDFDEQLMAWEEQLSGIMLAPGACSLCSQCSRADNMPCRHPDAMRISLDAYCIEIIRLVEELCGIQVQWDAAQSGYVTIIGAVLSNKPRL